MNVHQAAELWQTSESTVQRYCKKGYVLGAYMNKGKWQLPEGYPQPFVSRKRKFKGTRDKLMYVLKAIASEKFLDSRLLSMPEEEFNAIVTELQKQDFVNEARRLTPTGVQFHDALKHPNAQNIQQGIQTGVAVIGLLPELIRFMQQIKIG